MSLKDTWVDIQIGTNADPEPINNIARTVIEDEKKIYTNTLDILFMKNISIPAIEQDISDLQDETLLNKNNIDVNTAEIEKNKRETSQIFSNALKESKKSKSVLVDNISPIEHIVKVKASGKNLFGLAGRVERSMGGTYSPARRNLTGGGIYYAVSGSNYYSDLIADGKSFSDKYLYDNATNTLSVTSASMNYGLAIDIAVKPFTTYTISGAFSSDSYFYISQYDKDGNFITSNQKKSGAITTKANTAWILLILMADKNNATVTATNLQFEEGSVATEYEPYIDPTTIQIQVYDAKNNVIAEEYLNGAGVLELSSSILMPSATITTTEKLYDVEVEYNRDINTLNIGSGGADVPNGDYIPTPTTAQVGDILKVKAIDENGKPVEWECANESGGGSGGGSAELELLYDGTTTEEVSRILISTDAQGNSFELEELYAEIYMPDSNTNKSPYVYLTDGTACYTIIGSLNTNNRIIVSWNRKYLYANANIYQYKTTFSKAQIFSVGEEIKVNQFRTQLFGDNTFAIGTKVRVWGRRV